MSHAASTPGHDVPSDPAARATIRADRLRSALDAVGALVSECRLELRPDGLSVCAADPAAVALVDLSLSAAAFESYEADGELVGVDLERLADVVGIAGGDQQVRLLLDAETRRLHVLVDELSYAMGLLDPDAVRASPEIDEGAFAHTARAVVAGADVDRFVGAASMVADHVALGVDDAGGEDGSDHGGGAFYVDAEGDTDRVSFRLGADDLAELDPGEAHSLFSVDYLEDLARPVPTDAAVTVRLGTEVPVRLGFELADGVGSVEYLLSPRLVRR